MKGKKSTGSVTEGVVFILFVRLHILSKVSRENDHSITKLKANFVISFAKGSGKYKVIECKGDSSVACAFNRFICFFSLLFWLLEREEIYQNKK